MNALTIIVLIILGFFALIQILISMALKNIAEILTIASFGLKSVYKINEDSSSDSAPTKMKSSPALAPKRNTQLESEQGPIPRPPKPSKQ